jgi:hypothetical protein
VLEGLVVAVPTSCAVFAVWTWLRLVRFVKNHREHRARSGAFMLLSCAAAVDAGRRELWRGRRGLGRWPMVRLLGCRSRGRRGRLYWGRFAPSPLPDERADDAAPSVAVGTEEACVLVRVAHGHTARVKTADAHCQAPFSTPNISS